MLGEPLFYGYAEGQLENFFGAKEHSRLLQAGYRRDRTEIGSVDQANDGRAEHRVHSQNAGNLSDVGIGVQNNLHQLHDHRGKRHVHAFIEQLSDLIRRDGVGHRVRPSIGLR